MHAHEGEIVMQVHFVFYIIERVSPLFIVLPLYNIFYYNWKKIFCRSLYI